MASSTEIGAAIGTAVGGPGAGTGIGAALGSLAGKLFGGKKTACPGQASDAQTAYMLSRLSPAEMELMRQHWSAAHPDGRPFPIAPSDLSFAASGGDDCKHSRQGGKDLGAFFQAMQAKYPMTAAVSPGVPVAGPGYAAPANPGVTSSPPVGGTVSYDPRDGLSGRVDFGRPSGLAAVPWYGWLVGLVALVLIIRRR